MLMQSSAHVHEVPLGRISFEGSVDALHLSNAWLLLAITSKEAMAYRKMRNP